MKGSSETYERVGIFRTRVEAEMARSALANSGIFAQVTADDAGGVGLAMSLDHQGVEISVPRSDVAKSRDILGFPEPAGTSRRPPLWTVVVVASVIVSVVVLLLFDLLTN